MLVSSRPGGSARRALSTVTRGSVPALHSRSLATEARKADGFRPFSAMACSSAVAAPSRSRLRSASPRERCCPGEGTRLVGENTARSRPARRSESSSTCRAAVLVSTSCSSPSTRSTSGAPSRPNRDDSSRWPTNAGSSYSATLSSFRATCIDGIAAQATSSSAEPGGEHLAGKARHQRGRAASHGRQDPERSALRPHREQRPDQVQQGRHREQGVHEQHRQSDREDHPELGQPLEARHREGEGGGAGRQHAKEHALSGGDVGPAYRRFKRSARRQLLRDAREEVRHLVVPESGDDGDEGEADHVDLAGIGADQAGRPYDRERRRKHGQHHRRQPATDEGEQQHGRRQRRRSTPREGCARSGPGSGRHRRALRPASSAATPRPAGRGSPRCASESTTSA